ncbi:hypothetical protein KM043_004357 [Ampulex compressa]|nr:hypothetical protein KM043_004357 [Ampulex compressa]
MWVRDSRTFSKTQKGYLRFQAEFSSEARAQPSQRFPARGPAGVAGRRKGGRRGHISWEEETQETESRSGMSRSDWPPFAAVGTRIGPKRVSPPSVEIHFLPLLLQN